DTPQLGEPLPYEVIRQRAVVVEHRGGAGVLGDLERDLGALVERGGQPLGGELRERLEVVVKGTVAHVATIRRRGRRSLVRQSSRNSACRNSGPIVLRLLRADAPGRRQRR